MGNEILQLAEFSQSFHLGQLPVEVLTASRYCVSDGLGAALGAATSPELQSIAEEYSEIAGDNGLTGQSWIQNKRIDLISALLLNGMMAHDLELDDVHTAAKSHIGAVVIPTAWTLAEALGRSGREFLEAVIVGYEVMSRIGLGMDVASNRKRGWHTTGITGTFGSAAAAAKLMRLTVEQTANAFGLAGTQSSGLWAFLGEGATCKKLHAGRASVNGVDACLLAKGGMTGAKHILNAADGGLYPAVSDSYDVDKAAEGLGSVYELMYVDKKPYPCCRSTHPGIDAALKLREEGLDPATIESVLVETYEVGVLQCGFEQYPETIAQAKFSTKFTCAAAFAKGRLTQREFSMDTLQDPEVKRIASVTHVIASDEYTHRYPKRWGSCVRVCCKDGSERVCRVDDMSGSVAVPLTPKQEHDKFVGLAQAVMSEAQAEKCFEEIMQIETLPQMPRLF